MPDNDIGVDVVVEILAYRKVDPLGLADHGWSILDGSLDIVQLGLGADTAAEEELGRAKGTGREDDTASRIEVHGTAVSTVSAIELDTGCLASSADNAPDSSVHPQLEVLPLHGSDEVRTKRALPLAVLIHEGRVREYPVLLLGYLVGGDLLPAICLESRGQSVETFLLVTLAIHGGGIGSWNALEDAFSGSLHVSRLPASGEVVVPVNRHRLPPKSSIDSSASAEDAASHLVNVGACNTSRVNPDLIAKTRDIEAGQVGSLEPVRLHGTAKAAKRGRALLDEQDALAGLRELVCNWDTSSTGSNNDVIIGVSGGGGANTGCWPNGGGGGGGSGGDGRSRGRSLLNPLVVFGIPGIGNRSAELRLSVVVELPGVARDVVVLCPSDDLDF